MSVSSTETFNPILSDALNKIGPNQFVGTRILPPRFVLTNKGDYPVFESSQFDNDTSKPKAPGAAYPRTDTQYGLATFKCQKYGLEHAFPDEDQNQSQDDGIDDIKAMRGVQLMRDLMVGHERRVSALMQAAAFNSTAQTGAVMATSATAKPIVTIQNAVERLSANGFTERLALIMESGLFNAMLNTDDVRDIFNGAGVYTNRQVLLDAFGVNEIIICPTRFNSAAKGKDGSRSKVWPTNQYYVAQVAGGDYANGGFGRTMAYTPNGGLFSAMEWRDENHESDILRVFNSVDEVVINVNACEKITSA
jgi:hypothetical protein